MDDFKPIVRFCVVSDMHYKDADCVEKKRFEKGMEYLYKYADSCEYKNVDALYVVGDFANRGEESQMRLFKESLDKCVRKDTLVNLSMASHEYMCDGEDGARARFDRIFNQKPDTHRVINGFHFISVTCTRGCHFDAPQIEFAEKNLREAADADFKKPIFFFQHPHIMGTVYGSKNWGEDELTPTLIHYPQIVDFSGHSHAPVNDPRSVYQEHFSCFGTGTFSYFELDEFDKNYGTCPPGNDAAAQMLIVEADADNRVRVMPFDVISGNFFPYVWRIDEPSNPDSFLYTNKRYKTNVVPYFGVNESISVTKTGADSVDVTFSQANIDEDYVDDYVITVKCKKCGRIVKQYVIFSEYYLYDMPKKLTCRIDGLDKGEYTVTVKARGFWYNESEIDLSDSFTL